MSKAKVLLSAAGYDPTSGAGVLLDIHVFQSLGFLGMGILTAATCQNTRTVKSYQCFPPEILWKQYETLAEDVRFQGIKVGMVGCRENIPVIKKILSLMLDVPKVVDPVFQSNCGERLLPDAAIPEYIRSFSGNVTLLTPNLNEASLISGILVHDTTDMKDAARKIFHTTGVPCLLKGGHLEESATDLLYDGQHFHFFKKARIEKKVHGTGCFLSSSILAYLSRGKTLKEACGLAIHLTQEAIKKAVSAGKGQDVFSFSFAPE